METDVTSNPVVAVVTAPTYTGALSRVEVLDASGGWQAVFGPSIPFNGTVGLRSTGQNTSPNPAQCSIIQWMTKPDGARITSAMRGALLASGAKMDAEDIQNAADVVGTWQGFILFVVG